MSLHSFQKQILKECIEKKNGALVLPMGSGKTLISLKLAIELSVNARQKHLIVVSKSLLYSWVFELQKWFKDLDVDYKILDLVEDFIDNNKNITFYITTPSTLLKYYKLYDIKSNFITSVRGEKNNINYAYFRTPGSLNEFGAMINHYNSPKSPFLKEGNSFYSKTFDTIIIDEAHNYLNITTKRCQAICSVYAKNRWLLSGTLFSCVTPENVLGLYKMISFNNFTDNIPETKNIIKSDEFKGIKHLIVHRETNEMFVNKPLIKKNIINYNLVDFEKKIYILLKDAIKSIYENLNETRQLNAQLLAMICIIRTFIISPAIPIKKILTSKKENQTELTKILKDVFLENRLDEYLKQNIISTRIQKTIDILKNNNDEKIIIMSSFRVSLDYILPLLPEDRNYYVLKSNHSYLDREEIIKHFSNDKNGVLLMTYALGSEGFNLQFVSKMILLDTWWDSTKTKQSVARIFRYGQKSDVEIYMFYSDTYIEQSIFEKHKNKNDMVSELFNGSVNSKVEKLKLKKMIELIIHEKTESQISKISL